MSTTPTPLSRNQVQNAFSRLLPRMTEAMRRMAEQLLEKIGEDGSASVHQLHAHLFPATESTKSASAQLNNVLKKITSAAQECDLVLSHQFEGSKQGGTAGRKLRFFGPPPMLRAETETLQAIEPGQRIDGQLADPLVQEHKIVLLTFNEHEFNAVRAAFWKDPNKPPPIVTRPLKNSSPVSLDDLGSFGNLRVLHHHSRQGNRESQRAAADIQATLHPRAIVAVGIAFGADEGRQGLADVLVSKFVVDYELSKVHRDGNLTLRGPRPPASRTWVRALESLDTRQNASAAKTTWPQLHFGGLLSGEKLVDQLDYRDKLKQLAGQDDIVGGEMEAAGLLTALDGTRTDWLVVKAICDWADGQKGKNKERRQQHAAANAAQVIHALIISGTLYPDEYVAYTGEPAACKTKTPRPPRPTDAKDLMRRAMLSEVDGCASHYEPNQAAPIHLDSLNEQSHKLGAASSREETGLVAFDDIFQWINDPEGPPLYALLGEYGMGKTTTSQRVFEQLREQHLRGEQARPALYFDLRKVERLVPASEQSAGAVPSLQEAVEDCLKNGYLSDGLHSPTYADVLASIDQGAVVIFDGLDEVLSRIQDKQGLTFTANLLRALSDAKARRPKESTAPLPKVLLSCRTQFFRSLREQNAHLTGEHRGAQPANQYRAVVLRPFTEEQIRTYLQAALPAADIETLMKRIASVHNLTDLSKRPFTLKLVARFLPLIERWQTEGRAVTGATLYREVAREWLIRDKEKQSFQPEDKEQLAATLAAHLWEKSLRGLNTPALEAWLGDWLAQQPPGADCLTKPRALLQQDVRNATFLRRIDDGKQSRFEFSHSSLQEFFLAEHLAQAVLRAAAATDAPQSVADEFQHWAGPALSDETLDFLGQILSEHRELPAVTQTLNAWRKTYHPLASELLLRYALNAPEGAPRPLLAGFNLHGAQLRGWAFGAPSTAPGDPLLPMQGINFEGADLRDAKFDYVRLDSCNFGSARMDRAALQHCSLKRAALRSTCVNGTVIRHCDVEAVDLSSLGDRYRFQLVACIGRHSVDSHPIEMLPPEELPSRLEALRLTWLPTQSDVLSSVHFSPDGARIAVTAGGEPPKIVDAKTGEVCTVMIGHSGPVAYSPDGNYMASGSIPTGLCLSSPRSGEVLLELDAGPRPVRRVAFSPSGTSIAVASEGVFVWDLKSIPPISIFSTQQNSGQDLAFTPDGARLATSQHYESHLWDLSTGLELWMSPRYGRMMPIVGVSPKGDLVAVPMPMGVALLDASSGKEILGIKDPEYNGFSRLAFSPDGLRVAYGGWPNHGLCLADVNTGENLLTLQGHSSRIRGIDFSKDGKLIASSAEDRTLRVWDATGGTELMNVEGLKQQLAPNVAFSSDGAHIASVMNDITYLWDTKSGKTISTLNGQELSDAPVILNQNGTAVATAMADGTVQTRTFTNAEPSLVLKGHTGQVSDVAYSADGSRIATISRVDQTVRLWSCPDGHELWNRPIERRGSASHPAFSPDGAQVALIFNGRLNVWNTTQGELVWVDGAPPHPKYSAVFSPDGLNVLVACGNGVVRIRNAADGKLRQEATPPFVNSNCVAYSPDGLRIASGSADGALSVWDIETGQILFDVREHLNGIEQVKFSPDGHYIASTSTDGTMRLWHAADGKCLRIHWAGELAGRKSHAVWVPPGVEDESPEGCVISASGDVWRQLAWQTWDYPGAPGEWTRLPLGAYPGEPPGI